MILLDGRGLAQKIIDTLQAQDVSRLSLHIILVGDNPGSQKYFDLKKKK